MHKDIIFTFSSNTLEGYPIIGAGICDEMYKTEALNVFSRINTLPLDIKTDDPYEVDCKLQERIAVISPHYVKCLALSINVPHIKVPTGGIIGNPFNIGRTADNNIDDIGNGYCVAALPGGPGLMIRGNTAAAKNIFSEIVLGENKIIPISKIEQIIRKNKIDIAIIIKDGTGSSENGMIMTYCFGETEYISI
jgi:hypothetical protein